MANSEQWNADSLPQRSRRCDHAMDGPHHIDKDIHISAIGRRDKYFGSF